MSSHVAALVLAAHCVGAWGDSLASLFGMPIIGPFRGQARPSRPAAFDGAPVVISIGPVVDDSLVPRGFSGFPMEEFVAPPSFSLEGPMDGSRGGGDLSSLFAGLRGHLEGQAMGADAFQVETKGGHFKLRAKLPGYDMHQAQLGGSGSDSADGVHHEEEGQQPLSVEVVGRSLVVRGRKTEGQMTRSFQRSFGLPRVADAEHISVTYNKKDGALAVDVPAKPGSENEAKVDDDDSHVVFDAQESGSHTLLTFSSGAGTGGAMRPPPMLRGRLQSMMGDAMDLARSPEPAMDPFLQLFDELTGGSPFKRLERRQEQRDPFETLLGQLAGTVRVASPERAELQQGASVRAQPMLVAPSTASPEDMKKVPTGAAADIQKGVLAQPKNSWPYWRLSDSSAGRDRTIEIVAPAGTDLGEPNGSRVPVMKTGGQGEKKEVGQVDLPVSVIDRSCSWAKEQSSQERVLQCKVENDAIKNVHISIAEEL